MEPRGFFGTLFDTGFNSFLTTKFIRVLYVVILLLLGLASLFAIGGLTTGLSQALPGVIAFVVALPLALVLFLVYAILTRIWLEIVIVIFRMAENLQRMADQGGRGGGPAAGGGGYDPGV